MGRPGRCDGSGVSAGEGLEVREATGHGLRAGLRAAEQPEAGEGQGKHNHREERETGEASCPKGLTL